MSAPAATPQRPGSGSGVILFPGPKGGWEVWEHAGGVGARLLPEGVARLAAGAPVAAAGLPVESVYNFVFQAPPADASALRSLVSAQLEQRSLTAGKGRAPVFDAFPVGPSNGGNLRPVLVEEFNGELAPELSRPEISRFETSARLLPLPSDGCALWVENNRLAIGVTNGGQLVYFQALSDAALTPAVLEELRGLARVLRLEGLMPESPVVQVWGDAVPGAQAALGPVLNGKVEMSPRPAPRLPARVGNLVPASVVEARSSRRALARRRWILRAAGAAYVVAMGAWIGVLSLREAANRRLGAELAVSRVKVERLQASATSWKEMQPAVDPSNFPLTLLLAVRRAMPAQDLWLTEFQLTDGVVDLRGATTEVDLVYQFREKLTASSAAGGIEWTFDTPSIGANNLTQFRVRGTLPYATTQ